MGARAWLAYEGPPPTPDRIAGKDGETVVTDDRIREGKEQFQRDGLMNHGSILGNEGLEYLEVGKLWQFGLLVGFGLWAALAIRGLKRLLDREEPYGLAHMILYAGGSIAMLFAAGFLFPPETNIAVTEFWRWWVVHMWVEGAFEFFIVALVGVTLVSMNSSPGRAPRWP